MFSGSGDLTKSGKLMDGNPVKISEFWTGFPENLDRIDAVYERFEDGKIVFFRGESVSHRYHTFLCRSWLIQQDPARFNLTHDTWYI